MNTDTGAIRRIYSDEDFKVLQAEGPWVEVSEKVANAVEVGMVAMNHAERRALKHPKNKRREETGYRRRS